MSGVVGAQRGWARAATPATSVASKPISSAQRFIGCPVLPSQGRDRPIRTTLLAPRRGSGGGAGDTARASPAGTDAPPSGIPCDDQSRTAGNRDPPPP